MAMKGIIIFCIVFGIGLSGYSQVKPGAKPIAGAVKTEKGKAVPFASITVVRQGKGVLADSLGKFQVNATKGDSIRVTAIGYLEATVTVNSSAALTVYLKQDAKSLSEVEVRSNADPSESTGGPTVTEQQIISGAINDFKVSNNLTFGISSVSSLGVRTSLQDTHQTYDGLGSGKVYTGSLLPVFSSKEDTKGSRYLFGEWTKGAVITEENKLIQNDSLLFNYDKMARDVLVTQNRRVVVALAKQAVKSFELIQDNKHYKFEKIPLISDRDFLQVLVESDKYCLYKMISTKLERANYVSDGLTESGHNYDEYVDAPTYFVVFPSRVFRTVELKRKAIKQLFYTEEKKVRRFFSAHNDEFVNEEFLTGLISSLNQ